MPRQDRIPQKKPGMWARGAGRLLIVLACVPFLPSNTRAGVLSMTMTVTGMTCPLCTRGVEESIRTLDGIGAVTADLASGRVRVEAREGKSLTIQQVKERVLSAGFRIGSECEVVASARFTLGAEGRLMLRVPGTLYAYQVLEGSELRRLIKAHPGLKGEYVIAFRIHDHPNWKPAAASITSFDAGPESPVPPGPPPATVTKRRAISAKEER